MPHVIVKLIPGNSEEQKARLARAVSKSVLDILGKPERSISVAIEEVAKENWINDVFKTEIRPVMEKLYIRPGYDEESP